MLCVTGNERSVADLVRRIEATPDVDLHEVRLDLLDDAPSGLWARLPAREKLVATCRPKREGGGWDGAEEKRVRRLREALDAGVGWIDIEGSTPAELLEPVLAAPGPTRRIVSAHLPEGDPETPLAALARLGAHRAHVLKLALPIEDAGDLAALREAAAATRRKVVAIGTGPAGALSRVAYRAFGSEWTYVAADERSRTAPGQWTLAEARRAGLDRQAPRVFGLLGGPAALRSPGPRVYNALLPRSGQPLAYVALPTSRPGPVLDLLRAEVLAGLSVTMPHKEAVRDLLDEEAPSARRAGSVNTIALVAGRLVGHSTDGEGALGALGGPAAAAGRRVLVLGAGGAARAVTRALLDAGATVTLAARRPGRAAAVADAMGAGWVEWSQAAALPFDILVNATPLGADGISSPVADPATLAGRVVLDLVLDPPRTPLVEAAERAEGRAIPGIVHWAHQGAAQMRLLAGLTLDPADLLRAAQEPPSTWEGSR